MDSPPPPAPSQHTDVRAQPETPRLLWTGGNKFALIAGLIGLCVALLFSQGVVFAVTCEEGLKDGYYQSCEDIDVIGFLAGLFAAFGALIAGLAAVFLRRNRMGKWA